MVTLQYSKTCPTQFGAQLKGKLLQLPAAHNPLYFLFDMLLSLRKLLNSPVRLRPSYHDVCISGCKTSDGCFKWTFSLARLSTPLRSFSVCLVCCETVQFLRLLTGKRDRDSSSDEQDSLPRKKPRRGTCAMHLFFIVSAQVYVLPECIVLPRAVQTILCDTLSILACHNICQLSCFVDHRCE